MRTLPLILATILYLWQAITFALSGQSGMALVFLGYAAANIGLILAAGP